jgi:hypothetical protein
MAQVQCPRCGDVLPESGSACPRCAQDAARVGDATRGRIEQLADGWSLPVRDDRVGDAHIVREVRTQNDLAAAPPVRNASIGSVLSALDQEFDGDDEGVDRFEERAPTRPLDRPPLVRGSLGPGPASTPRAPVPGPRAPAAGPRAPTMLADMNAAQDDSTREFDEPPRSQATVPPLPPPPPGPPPRGLLDIGSSLEPWEGPEGSSTLLPALGQRASSASSAASGTPPPPPHRPLARATPADPTMLGPSTAVAGGAGARPAGESEDEATLYDPELPVFGEERPRRAQPPPLPPMAPPRASTPSAIAAMTPARAPTPSVLAAPSRPTPAAPLAVRRAGVLGDLPYLFGVASGWWATRSELATIEERLALERAGRKHRLVETARLAIAETSLHGDELDAARERLAWHEGQRVQYAAAAAAADDEARRHDEERADMARKSSHQLAELGRALEAADARLRPLEKERQERKKAQDALAAQIAVATRRSEALERRVSAAQDPSARAGLEAELAAARAERQLLTGQAPAREAALRELDPRLAAESGERRRLAGELGLARDAAAHAEAHLTGAAREARDRAERERTAARGSELAREAELEQLGQVLDRDRPPLLRPRFRAVDEHSASIGQLERREREIQLARAGVDQRACARGAGLLLLAAALLTLGLVLLLR